MTVAFGSVRIFWYGPKATVCFYSLAAKCTRVGFRFIWTFIKFSTGAFSFILIVYLFWSRVTCSMQIPLKVRLDSYYLTI